MKINRKYTVLYGIQILLIFLLTFSLLTCQQTYNVQDSDISSNFNKVECTDTGLGVLYITTENSSDRETTGWTTACLKYVPSAETEESSFQIDNVLLRERKDGMEKKSYALFMGEPQALFGMNSSSNWLLLANHEDKSLLRNQFASYLAKNIYTNISWAPDCRPVDVVINGDYTGTYLAAEKPGLEENKITVQPLDLLVNDVNGDEKVDHTDGGFLLEISQAQDMLHNFTSTHKVEFSLLDPYSVNTKNASYVKDTFQTAEDALFSSNFADSSEGYAKYIDATGAADWYLLNETLKNISAQDEDGICMYYNPAEKKYHFINSWNYELSCGNTNKNGCDIPEELYVANSIWTGRLMKDPVFAKKVLDRWNETKDSLYSAINSEINVFRNAVEESAEKNFEIWSILGKDTGSQSEGWETRTTYESETDYLVNWLNKRWEYLDKEFNSRMFYNED